MCELFERTVITNGCEVWGFSKIEQLDVFQRRFIRRILMLPKGTACCMLYGETGLQKISKFVDLRMLSYWYRIVNGKQSRICNILYKLARALHENDQSNYESQWIAHVKTLLDRSGYGEMWFNGNTPLTEKHYKHLLKQRWDDIWRQEWRNDVMQHRDCANYRIFKTEPTLEPYLKHLSKAKCKTLARFRCRGSKLPIAQWKFAQGSPLPVCSQCNLGAVADEFHILLECRKFYEIRQHLLILTT